MYYLNARTSYTIDHERGKGAYIGTGITYRAGGTEGNTKLAGDAREDHALWGELD